MEIRCTLTMKNPYAAFRSDSPSKSFATQHEGVCDDHKSHSSAQGEKPQPKEACNDRISHGQTHLDGHLPSCCSTPQHEREKRKKEKIRIYDNEIDGDEHVLLDENLINDNLAQCKEKKKKKVCEDEISLGQEHGDEKLNRQLKHKKKKKKKACVSPEQHDNLSEYHSAVQYKETEKKACDDESCREPVDQNLSSDDFPRKHKKKKMYDDVPHSLQEHPDENSSDCFSTKHKKKEKKKKVLYDSAPHSPKPHEEEILYSTAQQTDERVRKIHARDEILHNFEEYTDEHLLDSYSTKHKKKKKKKRVHNNDPLDSPKQSTNENVSSIDYSAQRTREKKMACHEDETLHSLQECTAENLPLDDRSTKHKKKKKQKRAHDDDTPDSSKQHVNEIDCSAQYKDKKMKQVHNDESSHLCSDDYSGKHKKKKKKALDGDETSHRLQENTNENLSDCCSTKLKKEMAYDDNISHSSKIYAEEGPSLVDRSPQHKEKVKAHNDESSYSLREHMDKNLLLDDHPTKHKKKKRAHDQDTSPDSKHPEENLSSSHRIPNTDGQTCDSSTGISQSRVKNLAGNSSLDEYLIKNRKKKKRAYFDDDDMLQISPQHIDENLSPNDCSLGHEEKKKITFDLGVSHSPEEHGDKNMPSNPCKPHDQEQTCDVNGLCSPKQHIPEN